MAGGHLQRTGYRHGVLGVAALSALVAAMYTQSSFVYRLSETTYSSSPILSDAYIKPHRFATTIIVLNAISCALTALMSLVIDWHFAIQIPAYMEFSWVGLACCVELISVILAGISTPYPNICSLDKTSLGAYAGLVLMGKRLCSNWTAVFATSVTSLILFTFHLTWHMLFRLWHRAALVKRPTSPIDPWNTPLPKHYPISPHETQKKDLALDGRRTKPDDSVALDEYSRIFKQDVLVSHEIPAVRITTPIEDRERMDNLANLPEAPSYPPGLETEMK